MATTPPAERRSGRAMSARGMIVFLVAAAAVVAATVVGVRGLLASPVESVTADGTAVLQGTWEPYSCDSRACDGYVQAGGRSVFVVLPPVCAHPLRAASVTVNGRLDHSLGSGSYRATGCPH